jgi:hypothetical protein
MTSIILTYLTTPLALPYLQNLSKQRSRLPINQEVSIWYGCLLFQFFGVCGYFILFIPGVEVRADVEEP